MSMTVAGIAVLQICDQALDPADGHHGELQSRIGRAWKWLEQHRREIGSARTDWCL